MGNKATTAPETTQKAVEETTEEMVEVILPVDASNEADPNYYCAVNGVAMLIPKGVPVSIPKPYAEVVLNAMRESKLMRDADAKRIEKAEQQRGNMNY